MPNPKTETTKFGNPRRKVHMAAKIGQNGEVSAACFKKPHPINMKKESWTLAWYSVDCKNCLKEKPNAA